VLLKTVGQGGFQVADLAVELADDADRGPGGGRERRGHRVRRGQLRGAQCGADLLGPLRQIAAPAGTFERRADLRPAQPGTLGRGRAAAQYRQRVSIGQIAEGDQGRRVVLPQRRAQRVGVPGAGPDQVLVTASQHLDCLRGRAVPGQRAVVVPVGADQIGQQLGVPGIGLRPGQVVPVPVAGHHQRIDRIHPIARRGQRVHPQAAIGLDPDHHLVRLLDVPSHQLVQPADPGQPLRQPPRGQPGPGRVHQVHVVMVLGPVITNKDHQSASPFPITDIGRAEGHPAATSWISARRHDTPSALQAPSPTGRGTI